MLTPNVSDYSFPLVVLTLQRDESGANARDLVQFGYVLCADIAPCNDIPNDGKLHFWYTKNDNEFGKIYLFDQWYHAPVLGREYRFKIEAKQSAGNNIWQYCIKDKGTGEAYDCRNGGSLNAQGQHVLARSWSAGEFAWYGTETQNTESQNGNGDAEADLDLRYMQYRRTNWYVVTDQGSCIKTTEVFYPGHYECSIRSTIDVDGDGQVNDRETLWSYTELH